jgi:signal peptidase I
VAKRSRNAETVAADKPKETPLEFLTSLARVLVTASFILTFVVQSFAIPSSSMENTLLVGDHVFVNRVGFAPRSLRVGSLVPYRDIHRGDIVVFLSPETPGLYVVKRIIGIPGDRIHLRQGVVYRNGERLEETYVLHDRDNPSDEYRNNFPMLAPSDDPNISDSWRVELPSHIQGQDLVVPSDAYFGMGDHRGVSLDSPLLGIHSPTECDWTPDARVLVIRSVRGRVHKNLGCRSDGIHGPCHAAFLRSNALAANPSLGAVMHSTWGLAGSHIL